MKPQSSYPRVHIVSIKKKIKETQYAQLFRFTSLNLCFYLFRRFRDSEKSSVTFEYVKHDLLR